MTAHWIILTGLAIAGLIVLGGIIRALRAEHRDPDPEATPWFRFPLAILLAVCAYLVVNDDPAALEQSIARERTMLFAWSAERCPERRADDADAIVLTIHHYADARPEDRRMTCARLPQRLYELRHPQFAGLE